MTAAIPMDFALFFIATFLGAVVAGVAGFAFGLIASALWLHSIPPAQSAPLIAAFAILIQGATLWKIRHAVKIARLLPFISGAAVGIPLGAAALNWMSPDHMRAFIGAMLIVFSICSLARPTLPAVEGGVIVDSIVGLLSGAFSGSTGLAGIPIIVWGSLRRWSKDDQRAVFQPVVVAVFHADAHLVRWHWHRHDDDATLVWDRPARRRYRTWLGLKLYGRLDEATFGLVVLILLLTSGLALLPWPWGKGG